MEDILKRWSSSTKKNAAETKKFLKTLKNKDQRKIDQLAMDLHDEAFQRINCLKCANCCKTISPIFKTPDIKRISSFLKMRESEFIDTYLTIDEDDDFVTKSQPCPFLGADNYCSIYEVRPRDCRDYPHTDKRPFTQLSNTHVKNTVSCPATFHIIEEMKKRLENRKP